VPSLDGAYVDQPVEAREVVGVARDERKLGAEGGGGDEEVESYGTSFGPGDRGPYLSGHG
jgi:hypothetical protein